MLKRFATVAAALAIGLSLTMQASPALAGKLPSPNNNATAVTNHVWRDGAGSVSAKPIISTYKVRGGDTLSEIARKHNLKWKELYCENKKIIGRDPNMILTGMRLKLKNSNKICHIPAPKANGVNLPTANAVPVQQPQATTTQAYIGSGSFQQCVIMRESGGNPSAVNPYSGAGGLYQFLPSTWAALGFPGLPQDASVAMQNAAFEKEYAQSGTSAWAPYDGC